MKQVEGLIARDRCVISGLDDLEHVETLPRFPVFMGCVDFPSDNDLYADMNWMIGRSSGCIQLNPLIPSDLVYLGGHNDSTGNVWKQHHSEFAKFILRFDPRSVLEIGGAHGLLWNEVLSSEQSDLTWTIVEPNPQVKPNSRLRVIPGFFTSELEVGGSFDAIVHSHFFEHTYDPRQFMAKISEILPLGGYQIFSVPDLYFQMANGITSSLNFEHTFLLTAEYIEYLLSAFGFEITRRGEFGNHSRFYAAKKVRTKSLSPMPALYSRNLLEFKHFLSHLRAQTQALNEAIGNVSGDVYLFGAHIFTQYLLHFGLDTGRIAGVLDNSPLKIGRRLYGSNFKVSSPSILAGRKDVTVVLKASFYTAEIMADIKENISADVKFIL